jgi:heterodisulfide reductase subunit E
MAVHAYFSGLITDILLIATILICIAGFWLLFTRWGQGRPGRFFSSWISESFLDGSRAFLRVLILDVLLFRRIWRRNKRRWAVHMAMFWGFFILAAFTVLSVIGLVLAYLNPDGPGGVFARFLAELHLPYDLLGYLILAGSAIALGRRIFIKEVRVRTRFSDLFLVGSVFLIALTGMVAEWFSGYATLLGPCMTNWDLALEFMSWHIYVAFLLFVMVIPWTKFVHIITAPLTLLARRGGD